jgi:hypothetical protein
VNRNPECENIPEDEINLYDYWKVLVKRKTVFIGIFLIPLVIVAAVSLILPRYYRGECEIINPVIPSQQIVGLIGTIDAAKIAQVFTTTPDAIRSVSLSIPKASTKITIAIESNAVDVFPQAFQDLDRFIHGLREIREELSRINNQADMQMEALVEARKANLLFLNHINSMIKKGILSSISINPADLIKKDADLSVEIMNLQRTKAKNEEKGSLGPISITTLPSNSTIKQILIFTGIVSFFAAIFIVFFLEYINRMKARERKFHAQEV